MSKLWKLIRLFQQSKGRSPSPSELANLKKQAEVIVEKEKIIRPDFGGSLKEFTRREDLYEGLPKALRNVKNPEEVKKLLDSGDIKIGRAPKTKLRDVNQEIRDLVAADEKASKRTEDFKSFEKRIKRMSLEQRAAERAKDLNMSLEDALKIEMKKQNKESAFNIAFTKYKDIDKKPMEMDEVISIYTNLNKYPKGRNIIVDDIADIQRGHILPSIGNRSREMLVDKLNQMIKPKKQPNPFKKAPDEVSEQIEMDFTDWDPKGMKGGGIAHMLGYAQGGEVNPIALRKKLMELVTAMQTASEEEIPMLALEARRIRQQLAKFKQEEPSIMEAAEEMEEGPITLEERIKEKIYPKEKEVSSSATIYAPGTMTSSAGGEKVIDDQITINELARIPNYMNMKRPVKASMMSGKLQRPTKGLESLTELIRGDITEGDPRGYEKGGRVPMMYGGDPGFAFEYGGSWADWRDNHQHMMPITEYIGTKLPKERLPFRQELSSGGLAGLPPIQFGPLGITPRASGSYSSNQPYGPDSTEKTWSGNVGFDATIDLPGGFKIKGDYDKYRTKDRLYDSEGNFIDKRVRDDHDRYNVGIEWSKKFADGGRAAFKDGGFDKGRRNFLKMAAGLASIPFIGKFFKAAKPAAKAVEAVKASDAVGMPAWFPKLVDKVMKEGKDVTKQYATTERIIVKEAELPGSKTKILVEQDLTTGDTAVDIGLGKHGWADGRHGQPTRLTLTKGEWIEPTKGKKGVKTKDEFDVEEAEFTGDAESVKFEDVSIEKYGDHASDFSEVERYATGKNLDKNIIGKKRAKDDWAEGHAESMAEQVDEFASGGIAHMLGR